MTDIPEDIQETANSIALEFNSLAQECLILDKPPAVAVEYGAQRIACAILAERERCAQIAADEDGHFSQWGEDRNTKVAQATCADIASAIRTPSTPKGTDK